MTWQDNVEYLYKKASKRLHFLSQLKRTRMPSCDIVKVYMSLVRPIVEYACQVWHSSLTAEQSDLIECVQQRALKLAFPQLEYKDALMESNLVTLYQRREELCKRLYESAQDPSHKLYPLLPLQKEIKYNTRNQRKFPLPKCKTERYKNSFVPYCLFKF